MANTGILVSDWPVYKKKISSSETTVAIGTQFYINDV
jgi:hypothetical protein